MKIVLLASGDTVDIESQRYLGESQELISLSSLFRAHCLNKDYSNPFLWSRVGKQFGEITKFLCQGKTINSLASNSRTTGSPPKNFLSS